MECCQGLYVLKRKEIIARNTYSFIIECEDIVKKAKPGQFVHVRVPGFTLRRPISICEIMPRKNAIRIVFEIRGEGTELLAKSNIGDRIDLMGPIGNGFELLQKGKKAIVVGGGIGVPPMLAVAAYYGEGCMAITGFRSREAVILSNDFSRVGSERILCTDDGTAGKMGFVTQVLVEELKKSKPDIIYACGPKVMLKAVAEMAAQHDVRCQLSLEERMACGVGACLGCACKIKQDGEILMKHVCKDGPVFEAQEVVFDD